MILTTAYSKIRLLNKKIRIVQGGAGASKTYSILQIIFLEAYFNNIKATVVTETYPQLKDGVIADMKDIVTTAGLNFDDLFNKSEKNLSIFGSEIQFRNIDNKDFHRAKGVRRDILFINEANRTNWLSVDQMMTRSKVTYFDFNPDREFYIHEHLLSRPDTDYIILTYQDNERLSVEERTEIESRIKASKLPDASDQLKQWVTIYAYGQTGTFSDRQIYSYEFIDTIPPDAKRLPSGMDFGLSPDPTTLVNLYIKDSDLYCDEVFTENNLMTEKIAGANRMSVVDKMEEVNHEKGWRTWADSANKSNITDLRVHGYNVHPVKKYQGAIIDGIKIVRSYNLKITKRSVNIKKGCEQWFFKVDSNGKIVPEPDGHEPDTLAAIRYSMIMSKKISFTI